MGTQVVLGSMYIAAWNTSGGEKKEVIQDGETYVEVFLVESFTTGNNWNVNM